LQPYNRFFVLTGGPGSGKTTLIEALNARGYATTEEAGRGVIREEMRNNGSGLPWVDPPVSPNSCSIGS
jgi:predicted ATPase